MKTILKNFIPLLILIISINQALAFKGDDYYSIIKVTGKVVNAKSKKVLSSGDTVSVNDKLIFDNMSSSCFVYGKNVGRCIVKPGDQLTIAVENGVKPVGLRSAITTRGASNIQDTLPIEDMFYFFGKEKFLFINPTVTLHLNNKVFLKEPDRVLVAKYIKNGDTVNKEIGNSKPNILVDLNQIFTEKDASGNLVVYPFEIYDYSKKTKDLKKCANINPLIINQKEFVAEIRVLLNALDGVKDKERIKDEVYSFVYHSYGEFDPNELNKFFRQVNINI